MHYMYVSFLQDVFVVLSWFFYSFLSGFFRAPQRNVDLLSWSISFDLVTQGNNSSPKNTRKGREKQTQTQLFPFPVNVICCIRRFLRKSVKRLESRNVCLVLQNTLRISLIGLFFSYSALVFSTKRWRQCQMQPKISGKNHSFASSSHIS